MKKKAAEAQNVLKNFTEFIDAVAFTVVALFAVYHGVKNMNVSKWYWGLLGAGLIVSMQASLLLVRHFNKTAKK